MARKKDFSKISPQSFKKATTWAGILFLAIFFFVCYEVYIPINMASKENVIFTVQKGWGQNEIASALKKMGLIRNTFFFKFYTVTSLQRTSLKAGRYNVSPRMSAYQIAKKIAGGDIIKNVLVIPEGWDIRDIGAYLESKKVCTKKEFAIAAGADYISQFPFLKDKPKSANLEGYLFPDTYEVADIATCDDIVFAMLSNFNQKLTPDLRDQISKQKKTIFQIITMASLLEKEVRSLEDKKIVSGILWKRISVGMPLQLDATINYITNGNDPSVTIKDTKIKSPYNTYLNKGLPKGPISEPGMDSIIAAINPKKTDYWFYLTDGRVIYSKTGEEHAANKAKYLD